MELLDRRTALVAAGSLGLWSCARRAASAASTVSILRASDYSPGLYDVLRRALGEYKLDVRGKRVLLKPNIVEVTSDAPVATHPLVVHAAAEAFLALGAASVRIAEGPGHRHPALDLADQAGYFQTIPGFERMFTDLNFSDPARIKLRNPHSTLDHVYIAREALAADLVVSVAKMKTHHWVGATLTMKNLFGTLPGGVYGWPKNVLHWAGLNKAVVDVARLFPRTFGIVDGILAMEGDGPIYGRAKHAGVIVVGPNLAAVDATCCRIMGLDPAKIEYLRLAGGPGVQDAAEVQQIAERVESVRTNFDVIPEMRSLRAT